MLLTLRSSPTKEYRIPKKEVPKCPGILSALVLGHVHSEGHVYSDVRAVSPAEPTDSSFCSESDVDALPADLKADSNVDVNPFTFDLDLNEDLVRALDNVVPVLPDDLKKLQDDAIRSAFSLFCRLKSKCEPSQQNYLKKCVEYLIRAIRSVEPNGKPFLIFLLLCSTLDCLGGVDSSCGGSCNRGHDYSACRFVIALNNILSCLKDMNMVQLVDEQDKCPAYSQNARRCPLKHEYVKDYRK